MLNYFISPLYGKQCHIANIFLMASTGLQSMGIGLVDFSNDSTESCRSV